MAILKFRADPNSPWQSIPVAQGGGGSGAYVGPDEPADDSINLWIDPDDESTAVLPIAEGGTGGSTPEQARAALGAASVDVVNEIIAESIHCGLVTASIIFQPGQNGAVVSYSLPDKSTLVGAALQRLGNGNWIYGTISRIDNSTIQLLYHNTYSGAITETVNILYFYTVSL